MKRTRYSTPKSITNNILLEGKPVNRAVLASVLGMQYGGNRNVYEALGYPAITELKFEDYFARYLRHDIAKAIIDRPVRATWQGPLEVIETKQTEDTAFEEAWFKLERDLSLKTRLARLDRLTGIGRYGVLLLGFDDVSSREGFKQPVKDGDRKLVYVRPFSEKTAIIDKYVDDPKSSRYGLPLIYSIEGVEANTGGNTVTLVHYSRVLHVTDEPLESEVFGLPRLEGVFNRLLDLDKVIGGDAEMFWRGARPGYEGKVDPEYQMTAAAKADLQDQIDEYENNLRRFLINEGIELKALQQQISDPDTHVNVILKCISAETGIPLRVLTGSERGELASSQDSSEWKEYVQARREEHAEPNIIRPLIQMLIQYGVLPEPTSDDYIIKWNDLYSLSEKARVEIGKGRATAIREYTYSPIAETILPPDAFLDVCLGLSPDQITLVRKQRDEMISQEELYDKILEGLDEPEPVAPASQVQPAKKAKTATKK